jgi:hypothetical protein
MTFGKWLIVILSLAVFPSCYIFHFGYESFVSKVKQEGNWLALAVVCLHTAIIAYILVYYVIWR